MSRFAPPTLSTRTSSGATPPRRTWLLGDPGMPSNPDDVRLMQQDLHRQGFDPKGVDGNLGPNTKAAYQQWATSRSGARPTTGAPYQTAGPREVVQDDPLQAPLGQAPSYRPASTPFIPAPIMQARQTPAAPVATPPAATAPATGAAVPGASAPGAVAATTAAAAPAQVGKFRQFLGKAGEMVKNDPESIVNAGLGVAGVVSYLTAKAPTLSRPQAFSPALRPAQGLNEATLAQSREDIAGAERQAGAPLAADVQGQQRARGTAAQIGLRARRQLTLDNAQALREDEKRLGQEQLRVSEVNSNREDEYRKSTFEVNNRQYESRRAVGAQMAQGALTYATQKSASNRQEAERVLDSNNKKAQQQLKALYITQGDQPKGSPQWQQTQTQIDAILAEEKRQASRKAGGGVLRQFGKGGKLASRAKRDPLMQPLDTRAHDQAQVAVTAELARSTGKLVRSLLQSNTRRIR